MREISVPSEPGDVRREHHVGKVVERRLGRQRLGIGGVDERAQPTGDALRASARRCRRSSPRAVLTSHAPSCMRASRSCVHEVTGRRQLRRVHGDDVGPAEQVVELHALDAETRPRPSSSRYGSATATLNVEDDSRSITSRPIVDAPITPMRSPRVPTSPAGPMADHRFASAYRRGGGRGRRNTSLAIITIAANVNSATGTAFAAAALDTTHAVLPRRGRDRHLHRARGVRE